MSNTSNLKGRYLAAISYVPCTDESMDAAFDRLRDEYPNLFPMPRGVESFWDAVAEVVARAEAKPAKTPLMTSSMRAKDFSLSYSVTLWGSNPDETDNDDCWTGGDYATRDEAVAAYRSVMMFPDQPFGLAAHADFEFVMLDGPDVHDVTANPDQPSQKHRRRDLAQSDREWRHERAMQAGMAFGCDGWNNEMGY